MCACVRVCVRACVRASVLASVRACVRACVCVCVCVNYVNYLFVYYITFVFSITVLSVLKYKMCVIVYCDVVNLQPRFNFSDEIIIFNIECKHCVLLAL